MVHIRSARGFWVAVVLLLAVTLAPAGPLASQSTQRSITVYLVRHAEKQEPASQPDTETPLVPDGHARAEKLAELLAGCGVTAAFTTQYKRTQDTANPLVNRLGISNSPTVVHSDNVGELVDRIRQSRAAAVLVVGHSNSVAYVVRALAQRNDAAADIAHETHDDLFVVTVTRWEPREASVQNFRFGKETPGGAPSRPDFPGCSR